VKDPSEFYLPTRLYLPSEVLASIEDRSTKGVYGWWFKNLPLQIPVAESKTFEGFTLLYVGTGPSTARSQRFLRERLSDHIRSDSTKSTLRRSLACLMAEGLGLEFQVARVSHRKRSGRVTPHFGLGEGEVKLSRWMEENARISWIADNSRWTLESDLIQLLALPLNLDANEDLWSGRCEKIDF
jgi:hypothetical protein